jgi:hypothetical protein
LFSEVRELTIRKALTFRSITEPLAHRLDASNVALVSSISCLPPTLQEKNRHSSAKY